MGQNIREFELGSDFLDITGSKSRLPQKFKNFENEVKIIGKLIVEQINLLEG